MGGRRKGNSVILSPEERGKRIKMKKKEWGEEPDRQERKGKKNFLAPRRRREGKGCPRKKKRTRVKKRRGSCCRRGGKKKEKPGGGEKALFNRSLHQGGGPGEVLLEVKKGKRGKKVEVRKRRKEEGKCVVPCGPVSEGKGKKKKPDNLSPRRGEKKKGDGGGEGGRVVQFARAPGKGGGEKRKGKRIFL